MNAKTGFKQNDFQPALTGFVPGHVRAPAPNLGQSFVQDVLDGAWGPWGDVAFRGLTGGALVVLASMADIPGLIEAILYIAGGLWVLQALTIALQEMAKNG